MLKVVLNSIPIFMMNIHSNKIFSSFNSSFYLFVSQKKQVQSFANLEFLRNDKMTWIRFFGLMISLYTTIITSYKFSLRLFGYIGIWSERNGSLYSNNFTFSYLFQFHLIYWAAKNPNRSVTLLNSTMTFTKK